MKLKLIILAIVALCTTAKANLIEVGSLGFNGGFTLNHNYNFNNPGSNSFGSFTGPMTASSSSGIFAPFVQNGGILAMVSNELWTNPSALPSWSIAGFLFSTSSVLITGPDAGRLVSGQFTLTGNGYSQHGYWSFTAPPYDIGNFHHDIYGMIHMDIRVWFDDGHVPDNGYTFLMLGSALAVLIVLSWRKAKAIIE